MGKARTMSRRRAQSGAAGDPREDSWRAPSLTASERAYMIRKAKEASVALVDHAHTLDGPVQWHYTGKFRGIQMYRGEGSYDRVGTAGTEFLCGVTTMMGSIDEVASYFDQQTTERMLAKKADDVLDCAVLYSLVQGDPNNPFYRVSAKYQLYEGPSAFSRERDYCFLECQNTFRHASGRRGWVLSMHSIKLPSCPEVDGVVRGSMYQSGYVFVEAEKDGYMDVMHSLQINFKSTSRLPHFLLNSALKRRILSVVTISREIQTFRMGRQTLLKKKDLMPKRARALCVNCSRKFSLFVRKTRCRVCGEVVCQPCAPQVMIQTKRGPVKTRVCTKCYQLSPGDEYEPIGALPNSQNEVDPRRMQNETRYSDILQDQHDHPDLYQEEDEGSMDEDEDEDGLEAQSDYSVFAQSRFTDASRDSLAQSQFGASSSNFERQFESSSQFDTASELDDSQYYDGGASENSYASGASTSNWQAGNSTASSMAGWHQASSVKPADGYIYDPQASMMGSNFDGSDYGASGYTVDEAPAKRPGRFKATAPIPEDEPPSHHGYNSSPDTSYNSTQVSDFKATQASTYGSSKVSNKSNTSTGSKTLSIHSLAQARSARYGIKSHFPPPPPPPPPLSPPPEEDEDAEDDSPLHIGALKGDKSAKDRKAKGIAARKMFTPPPPKKEERPRPSANRVPNGPRKMAFNAAVASRDSRVSQTSSTDSRGFATTRSSAILEQVRRNRCRTLQFTPESDRSSAVLKTLEEEHLKRMCEIERMQELAKAKAARRSMASNGSHSSVQGAPSPQKERVSAAAQKRADQPRRSSRRSSHRSSPGSPVGPPPGSPPGTPPSMRGRRLPNPNSSFNSQANRSFAGDRSRRTDASSDFGGSRLLSNRSNGAFAKSGARVSLAPSAQSEDLTFNSQGSGYRVSKGSNSSFNGRRLDASRGSSKGSISSVGSRRLNASQASSIPSTERPDDLAFDASQMSVDKSKFSSSIAILETPGESPEHVAMMERPSHHGSLGDSLINEDLLNQSSAGMAHHIDSMRARAAHQLPDEEDRASDELCRRQEEHRKRMEELTKMTANHAVEESARDSLSTLGGLHDSAISLTDSSGNRFGDSTISSISSASSVDIDDEDFDFESRPLGRTKRSGTIPFSLEALEQVPDVEDDDEEQSEGPDDSDTSFRLSEEPVQHNGKSGYVTPPYRPSEEPEEHPGFATPPRRSSEEHPAFSTPPRRSSVEAVEHERGNEFASSEFRPSEESVEHAHNEKSGFVTPPYRPSEESAEHEQEDNDEPSTPPRRSSETPLSSSGFATPPRRSSEHEPDYPSGFATPPRRSSAESVELEFEVELDDAGHRASEESVEHKSESEHAEPGHSDSDSEPEDVDAASRLSEEPVAPEKSSPTFQPQSSQLIPGEGGAAVDEFFAHSSQVVSSGKLAQVDEQHDDDTRSPREASEIHLENLEPAKAPISNSTSSTEHLASPRESVMSAIDEDLMNRPTEELFDMIRANRPAYPADGGRSSNTMHDLEASHLRRMEELNRIAVDHLGNRISSLDEDMFSSAYRPGRSLHPSEREDEVDMQWRSTDVMEDVQSKHEVDMERLRRRIRQLEEECRESIASVLTPHEMDLSELDGDDEPSDRFRGPPSFHHKTSFMSRSDLSASTISENMAMSVTAPQMDEPLPARVLFEHIAKLTQLQRAMAEAEDDDDEEEYRERIKEQYRMLRSIKANIQRQERVSAVSDDENWI